MGWKDAPPVDDEKPRKQRWQSAPAVDDPVANMPAGSVRRPLGGGQQAQPAVDQYGHPTTMPAGMMAVPAPLPSASAAQGEAANAGVLQGGTLGFADEIGGASGALAAWGRDRLEGRTDKSLGDWYREARDLNRNERNAARQGSPGNYLAGEAAGMLATSFIPGLGPAKTPGLVARLIGRGGSASRVLEPIVAGAKMGGAAGFGGSDADTVGGLAKDTGKMALLGAGTAAAGELGMGLANKVVFGAPSLEAAATTRAIKASGAIQKDFKLLRRQAGSPEAAKAELRQIADDMHANGLIRPFSSKDDLLESAVAARSTAGERIGEAYKAADAAAKDAVDAAKAEFLRSARTPGAAEDVTRRYAPGQAPPSEMARVLEESKRLQGLEDQAKALERAVLPSASGIRDRAEQLVGKLRQSAWTQDKATADRVLAELDGIADKAAAGNTDSISFARLHEWRERLDKQLYGLRGTQVPGEKAVGVELKKLRGIITDELETKLGTSGLLAGRPDLLQQLQKSNRTYKSMSQVVDWAGQGVDREVGNNFLGLTAHQAGAATGVGAMGLGHALGLDPISSAALGFGAGSAVAGVRKLSAEHGDMLAAWAAKRLAGGLPARAANRIGATGTAAATVSASDAYFPGETPAPVSPMESVAEAAKKDPGLQRAAQQGGKEGMAAEHYARSQTDPKYQRLIKTVNGVK